MRAGINYEHYKCFLVLWMVWSPNDVIQRTRNNTRTKTQNHINDSLRHTRETPRSSNDWRKIEDIYTYYLTFFSLHLNQLKAHLKGEKAKQNTCQRRFSSLSTSLLFLLVSYLHRTHMVQTGQQSVRVKKEDLLHNLKFTCYIASNTWWNNWSYTTTWGIAAIWLA